jgi:hypothetical protein
MTTRTATCACGRLRVTVDGDPLAVLACHCDACQRRSGSVFAVNAQFAPEQIVEISGERSRFNGLELDGVGVAGSDEIGIDFHFCPTCGATVYRTMGDPPSFFAIGVGCFVDPGFPAPVVEMHTADRHDWVVPVPDATQFDAFPGG